MNILHHKSWHVRTKSNMERVRRDERKAAEEEQRVLDRQIQSENERRINQLRKKADDRMTTMFGGPTSSGAATKDVSISDETGHVNLFQDLEREERKNLGSGNKEYEAEKAQEKREWESKMGIQVYFADGTNDLAKKKEWYEEMPLRRMGAEPSLNKRPSGQMDKQKEAEKGRKRKRNSESDEEEETQRKRHKKDKKHKKKKKRRHHRDSSEERRLEEEYDREKKQKLAKLRDERLKRERIEKGREYALLHPKEMEQKKKEEENERKNGKPRYNSQFNPEFFRK
ncbi:hypothetical protein L5515_000160 [Caenorhabditis briggsae]|uniref:CBF1-interacting co-repressor CIR N-terminal domain-containing protein n=1 Tax=Caenorhabditis briggsae TaxID=6238 RepID=A0AAE9E0W8_CAEBR|nr:hypothetical protein L5515_000160 [Caenorhabditis briggsae]